MGGFKLRIRRDGGGWAAGPVLEAEPQAGAPSAAPAQEAPSAAASAQAGAGEVDVPAPLLGNFYSAPRPGDPPFVEIGDTVSEDTTIAIIEVMKLMNPIRAEVSGTVVAILAENGSAVEEGQALIRVKVG
ncbi:acetyl-CoA carboxylase, biotin carboxyl carrier protein [Altererythrobacter salegens]|uniref:Biotin carboxyl carrier protein of acetyl-CoA carboxylase n=2 Tax=Croceibacterium salegens TaxID=1737568 RepID=A0A6I4SWQ4_9SPHN|nr:acetyl-CoA carboxylase, biotin carboxyl carrier protein [Croceibacterium salegens]